MPIIIGRLSIRYAVQILLRLKVRDNNKADDDILITRPAIPNYRANPTKAVASFMKPL
ncbi:hypothetical protein [Vulcanisaeta sp. EB80]|uniref:hypothetical protein n=1 Tax=Vulcanisaeta sp. EB80 TaxID=1650660 RepID=UPI003516CD2F